MLLLADLQLTVLLQQSLLFRHAQLPLLATDTHEPTIPTWTQTVHPPHSLLLRPNYIPFLNVEETLCEGVVDVNGYFLILVGIIRLGIWGQILLGLDELPDIILCDVIGVVRAAADLVEGPTLRDLDLVGVEVVFGLDITENEGVVELMQFSCGVDLMQRLIEDVQLFFLHLDDAAHKDRSVLLCDFGDSVVQVFTEGCIDVGGEARCVDALLLLNHLVSPGLPATSFTSAGVFVGLPLLLLRVADPHQYYQTLTSTPILYKSWEGESQREQLREGG